MADIEDDLEEEVVNDGGETERMKAELFGEEDDDDEEFDPAAEQVEEEGLEDAGLEDAGLEDDAGLGPADAAEAEEEAPAAEAAAPEAAAKPVDRKAALMQLASKRKAVEGSADKAKKAPKADKADKAAKRADKAAGKKDKGDKAPRSSKRQRQRRDEEDSDDGDDYEPGPEVAPLGPEDLERREVAATQRDHAFIDDDGAEARPDAGDEDGEEQFAHIAEAEEASGEGDEQDDIDKLMKPKKKKKKEEEGQIIHAVESFCAKMEVAAEEDVRLQKLKEPATHKLSMLKEVREFLSQKKVHEHFISAGGLGVLKAWIEPYGDASLPSVTVRRTILTICGELPVDTAREDMRDRLKRSELGSRIMFLYKCPAESAANKQLARELVERWSRPIFMDPDAENEKRRQKQEQAQELRRQSQPARHEAEIKSREDAKKRMQVKQGEAGYRIHAALPQASKLDYVMEPTRAGEALPEVRASRGAGAASNSKDTAFHKKMRDVQRRQKMTSARALRPSIEGRGMVL